MNPSPLAGEVETAARRLAEGMVRALPVTLVSVALWDQPSFALTVRAVSTTRQLPTAPAVGARLPLAGAPWHRAVFERHEPVLVQPDALALVAGPTDPALGGAPALRSIYLLPIRVADETLGVVTLGEMRSPTREPFSEEKRRRCVEVLDEFLTASAPAWEVGRLHRQMRAMSFLVQVVRSLADVRSHPDLLACLASRVADWVGAPVRGVLLRTSSDRRVEVAARWQFPEELSTGEATQLLLALARGAEGRRGPVSVVRVADDPLDPFRGTLAEDERWTRISLPLLGEEGLRGVACLYVKEDLYPTTWEVEALRWAAEVASAWMSVVTLTEEQVREARWLREATWGLLSAHQDAALDHARSELAARLATLLPDRVRRLSERVATTRPAGEEAAWREALALFGDELMTLLAEVGATTAADRDQGVGPIALAEMVGRAIDLARVGAPDRVADASVPPGAPGIPVQGSPALVGALAQTLRWVAEELPPDGRATVRATVDDGWASIAVEGSGTAEPPPAWRLGVAVLRVLATRCGGQVRVRPGRGGAPAVELTLPVVPAGAGRPAAG